MFSQNVFSAKDVLASSSLCDSNTWDNSQQYSQVNSYSQNSQLSSMDLFSQQKSSDPPRFDQYQRSQSQTTEDDPSTYYSKYVNNPPLFHGSSNNKSKVTKSVKDMIEEQKRNLSVREERDMLQTFINLLKDYTKEVNSTFQNFRDYMEKSFDTMTKNISDGVKSCDENLKNLKEEIIYIIETRDKESNEKEDLKRNVFEQTGIIKVLESKTEILEKQLYEAKEKESAYSDQKTKYNQLEQKYLQSVTNWDFNQAAFMGNTPPLSQHTDPFCNLLVPPLRNEDSILNESGNYTFLPNQVPLLTTGYGLNLWEPGHHSNNKASDYYNPQIINPFQMDPAINPVTLYQTTGSAMPSAASCLYSSSGSAAHFEETSCLVPRNSITYTQEQKNQNGIESNIPLHHNNFNNSGSNSHKQSNLIVSRRSSKRPMQSPMAMVRPQVRCNDSHDDDDIFLSGVKEGCRDTQNQQNTLNSALPLCNLEQKSLEKRRANEMIKNAPYQVEIFSKRTRVESGDRVPQEISKQGKSFRREESVKRKRSLVSMLGISSDDLEVQEITNSIKAQQRKLAKRIRSSS